MLSSLIWCLLSFEDARMSKIGLVSQVIKSRIANADYLLEGMPSERRISEELGISRTTVRAAVQQMVKTGVLARQDNGRLTIGKNGSSRRMHTIGLVMPIGGSKELELWHQGVVGALEGYAATLRPVTYAHLGDSSIADALENLDGVFFLPQTQDIPDWLISMLREAKGRVVVLDQDESAAGLPSVIMFPPASESKLLDHLVALGHRRIDCLITQRDNDLAHGRVGAWRQYLEDKGLTGQLRSLMTSQPLESGYRVIRDALAEGRPLASAIFCTSVWAAIGAMRALQEANLEIGRDVSVCAVNDEGIGHYLLKTLTALESPPRAKYLRKPVDWMLGDEQAWDGPLLIQPDDVPLFIGESAGPPGERGVVSTQPLHAVIAPQESRVVKRRRQGEYREATNSHKQRPNKKTQK